MKLKIVSVFVAIIIVLSSTLVFTNEVKEENGKDFSKLYLKTDANNENFDVVCSSNLGNNPPNMPSSPYPSDDATQVPFNLTLSWSGGDPDGDQVTYDLYINACPDPQFPGPYATGLTETQFRYIWLFIDNYYYWQIVAKDVNGAITEGPIWQFSTVTADQVEPVDNIKPDKPVKPTCDYPGPINVEPGILCFFKTTVSDPDEDNINLFWDMDEDNDIDFICYNISSGKPCTIMYKWNKPVGVYNLRVIATDLFNEKSQWSDSLPIIVNEADDNSPPNVPSTPGGVSSAYVNKPHSFSTYSIDPDDDYVRYQWNFGDGAITNWDDVIWCESGEPSTFSHFWKETGVYDIKVRAMDLNGEVTDWSSYKRVNIIKSENAVIFNYEELTGFQVGNDWDLFIGSSRMKNSDHSDGKILTGAFAGISVPTQEAWNQDLQGVHFYVGRQKNLKIDAEISFIGGITHCTWPAGSDLNGIIKVDLGERNVPREEYIQNIPGINIIHDLREYIVNQTSVINNLGLIAGLATVDELLKTYRWTQQAITTFQQAEQYMTAMDMFQQQSLMGNVAKESYINAYGHLETGGGAFMKTDSTGAQLVKKSIIENSQGSVDPGMIAKIVEAAAYIVAIWELAATIWVLIDAIRFWHADQLMSEFENAGYAKTIHVTKEFDFNKGNHNVYAGLSAEANSFLFLIGIAYAAGLVKNIKITGISPPEKPVLYYPDKLSTKEEIKFRPYCFDQNDDPVQYILDWGDGTSKTTTEFFPSETEGEAFHTYQNPGTYTITIYSRDCDRMESEVNTYTVVVFTDDDTPPVVSITRPENRIYLFDDEYQVQMPDPFVIGDITVDVDAYDDETDIDFVEFFVEGESRFIDDVFPYSYYWDVFEGGWFDLNSVGTNYASQSGGDMERVFYYNPFADKVTTVQVGSYAPDDGVSKKSWEIKSYPESASEQQVRGLTDDLISELEKYYDEVSLSFTFDVDFGDGNSDTVTGDYPVLSLYHDYDDKEYTISVTITLNLELDGQTYTGVKTLTSSINKDDDDDSSKSKTVAYPLISMLLQKFPMLSKILLRFNHKFNI